MPTSALPPPVVQVSLYGGGPPVNSILNNVTSINRMIAEGPRTCFLRRNLMILTRTRNRNLAILARMQSTQSTNWQKPQSSFFLSSFSSSFLSDFFAIFTFLPVDELNFFYIIKNYILHIQTN